MTRLLLIRHAPTAETGVRLSGHNPGIDLTDQGRKMATELGDSLSRLPVSAIYASPLERTWQTAELIAAPHQLAPIVSHGVIEADMGTWAGRTLRSLSRLKAWQVVQFTPSRFRFPDGESILEMQARAVVACEEIVASHRSSDTVLVVTHADIIKAVLSHYLGQPLDLYQRIDVAAASVSVIEIPSKPGIPRITGINLKGSDL